MSDANAKEKAAAQQPDSTRDQKTSSPETAKPQASPAKPQAESAKPQAESAKPQPAEPAKPPKDAAAQDAAPTAAAPDAATPALDIAFALVVDDEPANRDFLMRLLEQAKLDVKGASTAEEARSIAKAAERLELIVIDHKLPDGDGVDLMVELRATCPHALMVMATMHDERALMDKAFENGCDIFLVKPHGFMELFRRILSVKATGDTELLKRMIIDQYGPRPYRG